MVSQIIGTVVRPGNKFPRYVPVILTTLANGWEQFTIPPNVQLQPGDRVQFTYRKRVTV